MTERFTRADRGYLVTAGIWCTISPAMNAHPLLTRRLHIDLQRLSSAACQLSA
ncbi:MAG TPA: putative leader peptide [Nakamurella sp.]|nr:putative leader peptide [Nakamurella sp.]